MKCFHFYSGEKKEEPKTTRPNSALSSFGDHEIRQSGELDSPNALDISSESRGRNQFPNMSGRTSNLKDFTFSELKQATKHFSRTAKLGEGGFGCVYKGAIRSSEDPAKKIDVAVKQLGRRGLQGHKEWVTEVNVLGVVEHPNLVKLIGYCAEDDERGIQRLLIYEYMPNGSVEDHLSIKSVTPLSWVMRLKIALDSARGLAYLHEEMDFQIIFRDFKSSNILLDEQWNAKLSDFGLARLGPAEGLTHVSTAGRQDQTFMRRSIAESYRSLIYSKSDNIQFRTAFPIIRSTLHYANSGLFILIHQRVLFQWLCLSDFLEFSWMPLLVCVDSKEAWKVKSVPLDPTRLPNGTKYPEFDVEKDNVMQWRNFTRPQHISIIRPIRLLVHIPSLPSLDRNSFSLAPLSHQSRRLSTTPPLEHTEVTNAGNNLVDNLMLAPTTQQSLQGILRVQFDGSRKKLQEKAIGCDTNSKVRRLRIC
ncbi:hypothetical protein OROGR_024103 [Orobanche gracilis]